MLGDNWAVEYYSLNSFVWCIHFPALFFHAACQYVAIGDIIAKMKQYTVHLEVHSYASASSKETAPWVKSLCFCVSVSVSLSWYPGTL